MEPSAQTQHDFLNIMPAVLYEYAQRQDGSGTVRYVSPTAKEILGYPSDFFLEDMSHFWEIVHPDDLPRLKAEDEATVNDSSFTAEARIVWPSGEVRWVQFHSKPTFKAEDGTVTWIGCVTDITRLKHAEEQVRALHGVIPICSYCKSIRNDEGAWDRLEAYISAHSDATFSHGACPECYEKLVNGDFDDLS